MEHHFDPSRLDKGSSFRDTLRFRHGFTTSRLDKAQSLLNKALEKHAETHRDENTLSAKNFDAVMGIMKKDPGYHHLYSSGEQFESALRSHLKLPETRHEVSMPPLPPPPPPHANENEEREAA